MVKEPPFELQDPVDSLLVDQQALPVSQYGPYPPVSVGRVLLYHLLDLRDQILIHLHYCVRTLLPFLSTWLAAAS